MTDPALGRILIIEDNPDSADLLAELVRAEGFEPVVRGSAAEGLAAFRFSRPVATFIDWVLPDRPGIELCKQLRGDDRLMPIIFVSGREDEASVSRALDAGADDFVVKPVRRTELVSRLGAHLRKARSAASEAPAPRTAGVNIGDIEVDISARTARVAGREMRLGMIEFGVLDYLVRNAGHAVSREQIMAEVYGYDTDISSERVDLVIRRLRRKIGDGPRRAGLLVAVPGYGYRLEHPHPQQ